MEEDIATIWMQFPRVGKKPFILGSIYREHKLLNRPGTNLTGNYQKERWNKVISQWESLQGMGQILVTGDLNLDHSRWNEVEYENQSMVTKLRDRIETLGFAQLVRGPTHFWPGRRPSTIDHSWTNQTDAIISCRNILRPIADHNMIETIVKLKGRIRTKHEIRVRKWSKFDKLKFTETVSKVKWEEIYELSDVNLAYNFLEENLRKCLDTQIPVNKIQPSGSGKCWIKNDTKEMILSRDNLKREAHSTNDAGKWKDYKSMRNKIVEKIKKDKKEHLENLYNDVDKRKDTKSLFRLTKEQLGWSQGGPPTSLVINGTLVAKPQEIAEKLSIYFKQKVETLLDGIPKSNNDPLRLLRNSLSKWNGLGRRPSFNLRPATLQEVHTIVKELKSSTTMGNDELDAYSLKLVADIILKPLHYIIN